MDQTQIVDNKKLIIDSTLVSKLIANQFPQWKDLPVQPVAVGGWDNRTFHLGKQMLVRMPSAAKYAMKVEIEQKWLPKLAPLLPLSIPEPLAMGEPGEGYPWRWSIYRWIEGDTAASSHIANQCDFATSLAQFLIALQRIDTTDGPLPGSHNFYRGGTLMTYDVETRQAIDILKDKIEASVAIEVWEAALATIWQGLPVWVHGDISAGNLLVQEGKLSAVIDFGGLGIGDPACDLAIAWNMFGKKSREVFRAMLLLDADTWTRGRAWSLWKALIIVAGFEGTNAVEVPQSWRVINEVLIDYKNKLN
ncbi:aminoglycoside phosphotransferase family protein [Candidatus Tisiphia endosymbiont of Oplodontha viridula]|uniref:aminoglycoside phosphotransferase family protein n=1 Tax=Candidatus Tisiphia endosymbiont of Oplodontha viridula TaxID=3077925 RepID=UPI0035C8CBEE